MISIAYILSLVLGAGRRLVTYALESFFLLIFFTRCDNGKRVKKEKLKNRCRKKFLMFTLGKKKERTISFTFFFREG